MEAITYQKYGRPEDVLGPEVVPVPVPADDQVLIRVRAASINPYDWHFVTGRPFIVRTGAGLFRPKRSVTGVDAAGTVEAVGKDVRRFSPGDDVFGTSNGALAEYACIPESKAAPIPENVTFEQAAAVPIAALTALQALRDKGNITSGAKVLVNSASGGVGTFAVQIAKSFGAEVTGVCSTRNLEIVRSAGADQVIDYTRDDFTRSGQRYDLVLDSVCNRPLSAYRRTLEPNGVRVIVGGPMIRTFGAKLGSRLFGRRTALLMAKVTTEDLMFIGELLESGQISPVIDRTYTLEDAPEAVRYQAEGHAQGKVVVKIA